MAENKETFLFHIKWIETFKSLPKEKGYDLLMHMLSYVSDENPITDDILINVTFPQIKLQLREDLKKWELALEEKSKGGSIGNLKRWHFDLYNKYVKGKLTLEKALFIADSRKVSHTDGIQSHPIAEIAVYDNDYVLNKKVITEVETSSIDANKFISYFNSKAHRKFKLTAKVKNLLKARVKSYSNLEIKKAIDNAHLDKYHFETNFKYLTPEFILREEKLEKFINMNLTNNTSQGFKVEDLN